MVEVSECVNVVGTDFVHAYCVYVCVRMYVYACIHAYNTILISAVGVENTCA